MSVDYTNTMGRMTNPYWIDDSDELNEAITEEMGISREVEDTVDRVSDNIEEYIKTVPLSFSSTHMLARKYATVESIFGNEININTMIYFFDSMSSYLKLRRNISYSYKFTNESKTLYITVVAINRNVIVNTLTPKLAHEIRHALQYKKTNRKYLNNQQYYDATRSLFDKDTVVEAVSDIIYLSSRYEQESYAEEMYNELLFSDRDITSSYKNTNSWMAYESMKKNIRLIMENKKQQSIRKEIEKRGYSVDRFLQIAEKSRRRFLKYLSRAVIMAQKGRFKKEEL